jgi:signal transduction histidine kinase
MIVAWTGYQLVVQADYFQADYFYRTKVFERHYFALIDNIISSLEESSLSDEGSFIAPSKDVGAIKRLSDTFQFRLTKEDSTVLWKSETEPLSYDSSYGLVLMRSGLKATDQSLVKDTALALENAYFRNYEEGTLLDRFKAIDQQEWRIQFALNYVHDSDELGTSYQNFYHYKSLQIQRLIIIGLSLILALMALVSLSYTAGKTSFDGVVVMSWQDYIPLELLPIIWGLSTVPMLAAARFIDLVNESLFIVALIMGGVFVLISTLVYLSTVRRIKARYFFRSAWSVKLVIWMAQKLGVNNWKKAFKPYVLGGLFVYGFFSFLLGVLLIEMGIIGILVFLALNMAAFLWLHKHLRSLKDMMNYVKEQVEGNLEVELDLVTISPVFYDFASDLSTLHRGLEVAVQDALKNERMRTELITNVTHDLKNPLTSIISYVDLLSKEPLQNETAKGYISILSDKANRLKTLIDHLVEASKLSSGVVSANYEAIDLVAMLRQLEGELSEDFTQSNLQFIYQFQEDTALVHVDPKMLHRILENLLSNVIKYAMPGTRVYIQVEENANDYRLIMKNVSQHPLTQSAEELMERFVRADSARQSEGNGLGLSIAQSLAAAIGGRLSVHTDGDMFKVVVTLKRSVSV